MSRSSGSQAKSSINATLLVGNVRVSAKQKRSTSVEEKCHPALPAMQLREHARQPLERLATVSAQRGAQLGPTDDTAEILGKGETGAVAAGTSDDLTNRTRHGTICCNRSCTPELGEHLVCERFLYKWPLDGRGGEIRTPDPLFPKQMRYQTALRPDEPRCSRNRQQMEEPVVTRRHRRRARPHLSRRPDAASGRQARSRRPSPALH